VIFEGGALASFGVTAAKLGLIVITLDRYFKIVHAIAYRKYYCNWMTKVGVALSWIGGACLSLFPTIGTTRIVNGRCLKHAVWPNEAMAFVCLHICFKLTPISSMSVVSDLHYNTNSQSMLIINSSSP